MPHEYRAIESGTLSNPYRFVPAGEKVVLEEPLPKPSRWLIPIEEYDAKRKALDERPVVPNTKTVGSKPETAMAAHLAGTFYKKHDGIAEMIRAEKLQQAKMAEQKEAQTKEHQAVPPENTEPNTEGAQEGTGNKDVLG